MQREPIQKRAAAIFLAAALLLAFGCAITPPQYGPVPGPSAWTNSYPEGAMSPRKSSAAIELPPEPDFHGPIFSDTQSAVVAPHVPTLVWDWSNPDSNAVFEIWRTASLPARFALWSNAPAQLRASDIPPGFYKMRTRSTLLWDPQTQAFAVSDWAH